MPGRTLYDEVSYPGRAYYVTRPDHLATLGTLYGMTPAPAARCRVLELGCGIGGNLIPMAHYYPQSEFLGIDLSQAEIQKGLAQVAALGLRNVSFRHGDIASVDDSWGSFDYIVSHGVYSWVPPAVRTAMLAIVGRNLTPQGIAYISYNAHPGSHMRDIVRDIMNFHVRGLPEPRQQIGQARAILKFVAESSDKDKVYGGVLREQFERVCGMGDEVLFHDDLNEGATAFLLHKFVEDAATHGLQYLCDANFPRRDLAKYPDAVRDVLAGFPDNEFVARDQFQDFIDGHGFRTTLLCRADIKLQRTLDPDCVARYYIAGSCRPVDPAMEPNAEGVAEFKTETGDALATDHRLTKAALREIGRRWPSAISCDDLAAHALAEVALDAESTQAHLAAMRRALFTAALQGCVTLGTEPSAFCVMVSERPEACAVARRQAEQGFVITNRRHVGVRLDGELERQLLIRVDGTRTLDQLVADLKAAMKDVPESATETIDHDSVGRNLKALGALALLVA